MRTLGWLNRLIRNERGNALVIAAAALPLTIGAAAIGVDTVQVSLARRQLQRAADSAALAGAYALASSQDVTTAVNHDLTVNNDLPLDGSPTIENAPATGPYAGNTRTVRVVLTAQRAVPFMSFFTGSNMTVTTEATAQWLYSGNYCAVALEEAAVTGINIIGNATVNLGCGMISNSSGTPAVSANGSASITSSPIAGVGSVPPSANYASGTVLQPYSLPIDDPFADIPDPTVPSNCNNQGLNVGPQDVRVILPTEAVSPGVFCWRGMDIKGTLTLSPGIYIVNDADLDIGSQAVVTGTGVTFVLTGPNANNIAQANINGGATLDLVAPDSGVYAGLLFYQDRDSEYGTTHINGNATSFLRGAFYFPNRELIMNGTAGMSTECVQVVGRRLGFSGNASISNNCPLGSASQGFQAKWVRLVG